MKSLTYIVFLAYISLFAACENKQSATETTPDLPDIPIELVKFQDLGLELNNGEKWPLDKALFNKLLLFKNEVYVHGNKFEKYELNQYAVLERQFAPFLSALKLPEEENTRTQLNKIISECQKQVALFSASDLKSAQIALINMSNILDGVDKYFVGKTEI